MLERSRERVREGRVTGGKRREGKGRTVEKRTTTTTKTSEREEGGLRGQGRREWRGDVDASSRRGVLEWLDGSGVVWRELTREERKGAPRGEGCDAERRARKGRENRW